jgi:hypothetical protein
MKRTKQWRLHHLFYCMLAIALTVTACKKGDPGPQGDKGDKGDPGATGNTGTKGDPGTANVMYSDWLDVGFQLDQPSGVYFTLIQEPKLTDEFLSTGEVKVYINLGTPAEKVVSVLPYRSGTAQITPFFVEGVIELDANVNASTATDPATGNKFRQYRYVLIPGGAHVRADKKVDWNNYAEVKAYLGLKD